MLRYNWIDNTVSCDTPQELNDFLNLRGVSTGKAHEPLAEVAKDGTWEDLLKLVHGKQLEFLRLLKSSPLVTLKMAKDHLGLASGWEVAGVVGGGLMKNLDKARIPREAIVVLSKSQGERAYYPGQMLLGNEFPGEEVKP